MITLGFDPAIFRFGGLEVGWHGLFTGLAVFAGVWLGIRRSKAYGIAPGPLGSVAIWAIAFGIVGARLFHVLDHLSDFQDRPLDVIAVWEGGIAVYGAFIGGTLGGVIAARRYGLPAWQLLDATAPAILISQMIGRLGCLSNGDAWGEPTGGDWGLVYQHPDALLPSVLLGVPTHPYPLYEMIATTVLLGTLLIAQRHLRVPGELFLFAAIGYAVIRFSLTFFRQESEILLGLQEAQVVAIVTGLLAIGMIFVRRRQQIGNGVSRSADQHSLSRG